MAIDYINLFVQKTGMYDDATPWSDALITSFLDQAAYKRSRNNATPWADFDSITEEKYKYLIVLVAAYEYWWMKLATFADRADIRAGGSGGIGKLATTLFDRAMQMLKLLEEEIEQYAGSEDIEGSGDILVGDLLIRSKQTGNLIPRSDDPTGRDWLS